MSTTENQTHASEDMLATRQSLAATIDRLTAETPVVTSEAIGLKLTRLEAPIGLVSYSRLFGAPPLRDVKALRRQTADSGKRGAKAEGATARNV